MSIPLKKPHQAVRIEDRYFSYDEVGNVIRESALPSKTKGGYEASDVQKEAWEMEGPKKLGEEEGYLREFTWNEDNRLKAVKFNNKIVSFLMRCQWRANQQAGHEWGNPVLQLLVLGHRGWD